MKSALNPHRFLVLLLLLAGVAGCATSADLRAKRIKQEWDYFTALPPETQARLQAGQIAIGDSRKMAWIALGGPDREYRRIRRDGTNVVWSYTDQEMDVRRELMPVTGWSISHCGRGVPYYDYGWVRRTEITEYEVLRLEFDDDAITTVDDLTER